MVSLPYPNQHSARLHDPKDYDSFATKKLTDGVTGILGIKDGKSEIQAYRFDKKKFTVAQAKKWLKDNKAKPISFEPAKDMSKGALESESKIIKREGGKIYVAGVLQRSGVYNGGLKSWEEWRDSIPLMVNIPLVRGEHPEDPISGDFVPIDSEADIIGRIAEAIEDKKRELAMGIYELDEEKLTSEEIKDLEDGKPIGTSPGYWCEKKMLPTPKLWEDGTPYTFIEEKQFRYDHFATPLRPACHDCGMLINSKTGEDGIGKVRTPEEIKEAVAQLKDEGVPTFMVNQAIDEVLLQNKILDILECKDSFAQTSGALRLLVQLLRTVLALPEPSGLAAMSQAKKDKLEEPMEAVPKEGQKVIPEDIKLMVNAAVEEASKPLKDELVTATKTIEEQAKVIEAHKTALAKIETSEAARVKNETEAATAAAATAEEGRKKSFLDKLKPGIAKTAEEATKLWETAKSDLGSWILANPDKMAFSGNAEVKYAPKGQPVVQALSANSADERDQKFRDMGIKPASDLIKELYPEGGK